MKRQLILWTMATVFAAQAAVAAPVANHNITEADVKAAQDGWGAALIQISNDHKSGGVKKATATAQAVLDKAYGYNMGPVLFKPTLATGETTFRPTIDGALSYFVGGNKTFGDGGFALKNWKEYEYRNAAIYINGNVAMTQGHVILTNDKGEVTTVDKTWGFHKDENGDIRIVLHHSSLPYSP